MLPQMKETSMPQPSIQADASAAMSCSVNIFGGMVPRLPRCRHRDSAWEGVWDMSATHHDRP